jgi:hypothetical protein
MSQVDWLNVLLSFAISFAFTLIAYALSFYLYKKSGDETYRLVNAVTRGLEEAGIAKFNRNEKEKRIGLKFFEENLELKMRLRPK